MSILKIYCPQKVGGPFMYYQLLVIESGPQHAQTDNWQLLVDVDLGFLGIKQPKGDYDK